MTDALKMTDPRNATRGHDDAMGEDWLDHALRASRATAPDDDGFTLRVMAALPAVETAASPAPAWRAPVVSLLWILALIGAAISLPGVMQDVARGAYRIVTAYPVSVGELALAVAAAALIVWTGTALALRRQLAALG